MFRKRVKREETATIKDNSVFTTDGDKNGVLDYMERKDIPSLVQSNKDLNQWEADVQKEVEEWINGLRGYEFHADSNVYKPICPPVLNELGIKQIQTHISTVVNKHSINTALDERDVHQIVEIASLKLTRALKNNCRLWQIRHADLDSILWQFDNLVYIVLSRSIGDRQRDHVTKRTRLTGQVSQPQGSFP